MTQLTANAHFHLTQAGQCIGRVCAHFREHEMTVSETESGYVLRVDNKMAQIVIAGETVSITAQAPDADSLYQLRLSLTAHIREYAAQDDVDIRWRGAGMEVKRKVNFQVIRVADITDLTPHLRRFTFTGTDMGHFATDRHLHCKLYFPQPGVMVPQWPVHGDDGMLRFPTGAHRLDVRTYTIRSFDMARQQLTVDIVLHGDGGPGAAWARHACIGQEVGITGPGGQGIVAADWYLLMGDETALPAIGRILAGLPAHASGMVLLEVQGEQDMLPLVHPAGIRVRWLFRGAQAAGTTTLISDALSAVTWPADETTRVFAWAGLEFSTFKTVRTYLREERLLTKEQHLVVAYWRKGQGEAA